MKVIFSFHAKWTRINIGVSSCDSYYTSDPPPPPHHPSASTTAIHKYTPLCHFVLILYISLDWVTSSKLEKETVTLLHFMSLPDDDETRSATSQLSEK